MIKVNLVLTNYLAGNVSNKNAEKVKAANSVRELLSKIDYKAELVPENNLEMFTRLLTSLKGEPLNKLENEIIEEVINYGLK